MLLNGKELAGFIKERQARQVQSLQYTGHRPQLAIVQCQQKNNREVVSSDAPPKAEVRSADQGVGIVSSKYITLKQKYGTDIGIDVQVCTPASEELSSTTQNLNQDKSIHGIIVQLPLPDGIDTDAAVNLISPAKDVDGLGERARYDAATPTAIMWLLSGYDIDLRDKEVAVIGQGRLVGAPFTKMLQDSGITSLVCDETTDNLDETVHQAQVIITATGQPGLITNNMVQTGQIVIDAGTADAGGSLVGDADPVLYERDDIKISPVPGGVGPLTVCALFENVIKAFREQQG